MKLASWFNELNKNDADIAGGKGASLGEMTQAKIPVPNGFVVLSDSFEQFLKETDLNVEINSILGKVNHNDINSVEVASEQIKALILSRKMPKDIAREIEKKFKKLDSKYVAVRSSATSEDSADAAWAGQLESYLNTTKNELLANVKKCWASLFTPRAIFYRFEKGLHKTKISVAVVVQKMINSEISGIAFSVHPITQDYNQLIIEAGYGLGEAIVSGSITPDSYVLTKEPRKIIDINIADQEKGLFRIDGGGNEWRETKNGNKQKLSEKQILELSEIIMRIENHYNFPCDIEWALEKGKFYIVQSRPITTLMKEEVQPKKIDNKFEELIKTIKTKPLDVKQAKCSLLIANMVFSAYSEDDFFGSNYGMVINPYLSPNIQQIFIEEKENQLEENTWNYAIKNKKKFLKLLKDGNTHQNKINKLAINQEKIKKLNNKELENYFKKIYELSHKWWKWGFIGENKGLIVDKKIVPSLVRNHKISIEEAQEYIADITMPKEISIFSKERILFLEIAIEILKNKELIKKINKNEKIPKKYSKLTKKIREYSKKYFYSRTGFYSRQIINENTLPKIILNETKQTKIEHLIEEKEHILKEFKELKKKQSTWKKKIKPTIEEKEYLWYFTIMHKWIDDRKVAMLKHFYYLYEIYEEIAKRNKISYEELMFYKIHDLTNLLKGKKLDKKVINKRKKFVTIYTLNGQTEFFGKEANKIIELINSNKDKNIKGVVASKGNLGNKISGIVRIVFQETSH